MKQNEKSQKVLEKVRIYNLLPELHKSGFWDKYSQMKIHKLIDKYDTEITPEEISDIEFIKNGEKNDIGKI